MSDLARDEFVALRATIRERGTVRVALGWISLAVWASLAVAVATARPQPVATLVPLAVLVGGFEAIYALHVGVERLGRYLQVFHEERDKTLPHPPSWETTSMAYGQQSSGGRIDPLFTAIFVLAALLNLMLVPASSPAPRTWVAIVVAHLLFVARMFVARRHAREQRVRDLDRFRRLASLIPPSPPPGV